VGRSFFIRQHLRQGLGRPIAALYPTFRTFKNYSLAIINIIATTKNLPSRENTAIAKLYKNFRWKNLENLKG
jgi:hypothetical protein